MNKSKFLIASILMLVLSIVILYLSNINDILPTNGLLNSINGLFFIVGAGVTANYSVEFAWKKINGRISKNR